MMPDLEKYKERVRNGTMKECLSVERGAQRLRHMLQDGDDPMGAASLMDDMAQGAQLVVYGFGVLAFMQELENDAEGGGPDVDDE